MPSQTSRRFTVPIIGDGTAPSNFYSSGPFRPKYSDDGGLTGYNEASFDSDTVTATFYGDPAVLDLISQEADVTEETIADVQGD